MIFKESLNNSRLAQDLLCHAMINLEYPRRGKGEISLRAILERWNRKGSIKPSRALSLIPLSLSATTRTF